MNETSELRNLTLEELCSVVRDGALAIRSVMRLQPAGGPGDKVFPPTYAGGVYATEKRFVAGATVDSVLLDSVQSQANRMELALLQAYREKRIQIPLIEVDFTEKLPEVGVISSLEAPHRIADAILRDSLQGEREFRKTTAGQSLEKASLANAAGLFQYCPTALVFGVWDSTGASGGSGAKFQRVIVSEITGFRCVTGVKTSSRIDPLGIQTLPEGNLIYRHKDSAQHWTFDVHLAAEDKKSKKPVLAGSGEKKGKPSSINHGNVTPDIDRAEKSKEAIRGGVTIEYALQTSVISLAGLRRIKFAAVEDPNYHSKNTAAVVALASLALASLTLSREIGFDLRSRCLLVPEEPSVFEVLFPDGDSRKFVLEASAAVELLNGATARAREAGLPGWARDPIKLKPQEKFWKLIEKSQDTEMQEPS